MLRKLRYICDGTKYDQNLIEKQAMKTHKTTKTIEAEMERQGVPRKYQARVLRAVDKLKAGKLTVEDFERFADGGEGSPLEDILLKGQGIMDSLADWVVQI